MPENIGNRYKHDTYVNKGVLGIFNLESNQDSSKKVEIDNDIECSCNDYDEGITTDDITDDSNTQGHNRVFLVNEFENCSEKDAMTHEKRNQNKLSVKSSFSPFLQSTTPGLSGLCFMLYK